MFYRAKKGLFSSITVFLFLAALSSAFYFRGIAWNFSAHPDEITIAHWLDGFPTIGYIFGHKKQVYAEGFFQIHKTVNAVTIFKKKNIDRRLKNWITQEDNSYHDLMLEFETSEKSILYGRKLNASLVVIGVVLFFLTVKVMLDSSLFAFIAAIMFALNPLIVEHAHYCETEGAMIVMMMLSFYVLTLAVKRSSISGTLLGAFICGFAIASKYTIAPIMCVAPLVCVCVSIRNGTKWWKVLIFIGLSILCLVLGLLLGTPSVFLNNAEYFTKLAWSSKNIYIELNGLLGDLRGQPWAAEKFKLVCFFKEASAVGIAWWCLVALSLPLWFSREIRKFAVVVPLFVLSFVIYVVFKFPFFRSQEFIPMLPFISVSAILPLWRTFKNKDYAKRARIARVAIAAPLLIISAHSNISNACRTLHAFARNDTRLEMNHWTKMCASENIYVGYERFAGLAASSTPFRVSDILKIENRNAETQEDMPENYVARSDFDARGMRNAITGELFPKFDAAKKAFDASAIPLRDFKILGGQKRIRPTFSQVDMSLWKHKGVNEVNNAVINLPILPLRPAVIYFAGQEYRVPVNGDLLGPEETLQIVGKRRNVLLRPEKGVKYWAVVRHVAGDTSAKIKWSGMFEPTEKNIEPFKADYFEINPNAWRAAKYDIMAATRIRMKGNDQTSICLLTVTSSPEYAAYLLCTGGAPMKAQELLSHMSGETTTAQNIGALAQKHMGNKDAKYTDNLLPSIDALRGDLDDHMINVNGLNLTTLNDFSNIRVGPLFMSPHTGTTEAQEFITIGTYVPVWLIPGKYTVKVSLVGEKFLKSERQCQNLKICGVEQIAAPINFSMSPIQSKTLEFEIIVDKPMRPKLSCEITSDSAQTALSVSSIEFSWSPRDLITENFSTVFITE